MTVRNLDALFKPKAIALIGGTDLGPAIAAELMGAHGGEIKLVEGTMTIPRPVMCGTSLTTVPPRRLFNPQAHRLPPQASG